MENTQTFETAMTALEEIVKQLEGGTLPLSESLAAYEKAVGLIRYCNDELENVRRKVCILTPTQDGTVIERPFLPDET